MTHQAKYSAALWSIFMLSICTASPSALRATTITVSAAGEFGSEVTADTLAAPSTSWSLSFDVNSAPLAANPDTLGFDTPFSDFTYAVGGSDIAVTPAEIRFYTDTGGGLFSVFFGPETGFENGEPIPEFTFSGEQAFSGTTFNPTMLTGIYSISDVIYSDSVNYDDEGASANLVLTPGQTTMVAPEPSTLCLSVIAALLAGSWARSRRPLLRNRASARKTIAMSLSRIGEPNSPNKRPQGRPKVYSFVRWSSAWLLAHWLLLPVAVFLVFPSRSNAQFTPEWLPVAGCSNGSCTSAVAACQSFANLGYSAFGTGPRFTLERIYAHIEEPYECTVACNFYCTEVIFLTCPSPDQIDPNVSSGCSPPGTPQNSRLIGGEGLCPVPPSLQKPTTPCSSKVDGIGNAYAAEPINIASGNVFYSETDYETASQNTLRFTRYYNSRGAVYLTLGVNWRSNFDRNLVNPAGSTTAIVTRPSGQILNFNLVGGVWTPDSDIDISLTYANSSWTLTDQDDTVEIYSGNSPALTSITARNGYQQTLAYNGSGTLASVTDSYGRTLTFSYNGNGLLQSLTTPDGTPISYGYSATSGAQNLVSVTYPTQPAATVTYAYENATQLNALTGVIDENNSRYLSWSYDAYGRGIASQVGAGPTANVTTIAYDDVTGQRTVTNALGISDTYSFTTLQGVPKVAEIDRAATASTAASKELFNYDSNGYMSSKVDWNGNQTTYANNSHGEPTTINEAVGSPVSRTTVISYDSVWVHLPKEIDTPDLKATFTYDGSGEMLTKTLTDTTSTSITIPYPTGGQTRTWANTWANALLASTQGPRTDVAELTTFGYDASGALTSVTNAKGQITKITAHTGGGLPLTLADPNNVTTTMTYDARQRPLTSTVHTSTGLLTTTFTYDPSGNLIKTTQPDGSALTNTYDAAHRLTQITDLFHQNVNYTLDALGDRTQSNLTAVGNRIQRLHSDGFDALGRTQTDTGGMGQMTGFTYDPNGNPLTVADPLGRVTTQVFDALNRLTKVTDPNGGITTTSYDAHDRPLTVTDPNGNTTKYVYNGFGDVIQQVSPDSGTTVYHYDPASNLTQKLDASGNISNHTYDALDRILTTTYPADAAENVAYSYDRTGPGFGIGRLTSLTDAAGSLSRAYDERGNLLTDTRVHGVATFKTSYTYDAASRMASMTYPSGWTVAYTHDVMGRVWKMPLTAPGGTSAGSAITNATYEPFGPLYTLTFGNGVNEARHFDLDYRVTSLTETGTNPLQSLAYAYDANDNVSSIADGVTPGNSQALGYDVLNRLTSATGGYGTLAYTYDKLGNRLTQTASGVLTSYAYTPGSNRLASITAGGSTAPVSYTGTGNIKSIPPSAGAPTASLTYNAANRLASVTGIPLAITGMAYDAFGQRFSKTSGGTVKYFSYGQDGTLLEENDGGFSIDYVYLNARPVAEILPSTGKVYFLHDDRLGTPQLATDSGQNSVWKANYQPFGTTGLITGSITQDLRLPGQVVDSETGFNKNGFRNYAPSLGRYLESDPVGLFGGLNGYSYVSANPLGLIDIAGLADILGIPISPASGGWSTPGIENSFPAPPASGLSPMQAALPRTPDFYTFTYTFSKPIVGDSINLPGFGAGAGIEGITMSIDRYGDIFFGPVTAAVGLPSTKGASLTLGYLNQTGVPARKCLEDLLSQISYSAGGGYFNLGAFESYTPGVGTATSFGFSTRGLMGQSTYTFQAK